MAGKVMFLRKTDFLIRCGLDGGKPACFFLLIGRVKRMRLQFNVDDRIKAVRN